MKKICLKKLAVLLFTIIFASQTMPYSIVWATEGTDATLSDIAYGNWAVPGFDPYTTEYSVKVPYVYSPNQFNVEVPEIRVKTTDPNATVNVSYPASLDGDAIIVVTSANGSVTKVYTLVMTAIGKNKFLDGGMEFLTDEDSELNQTDQWLGTSEVTIGSSDISYGGEHSLSITKSAYGYHWPKNYVDLPVEKQYIASMMARTATEGKTHTTNQVVYDAYAYMTSNNRISNVTYYEENVVGQVMRLGNVWKRYSAVFQGENLCSYTNFSQTYYNYEAEPEILIDDQYVGELIYDVKITDESGQRGIELESPEQNVTIPLNVEVVNQFGEKQGINSGDIASELTLVGAPSGVTIEDGVLCIPSDTEPCSFDVSAEVSPSIAYAAQSKVIGRYHVDIPEKVDSASLADIEFNGGSVPGFNPAKTEYDVVVPYQYIENDFSTYTMPVVTATAANENAEVEVVYPQKVNNGTILINVTDSTGSQTKQYKINMTVAGGNKFPDGGFEGDTESVWYKGTGALAFVSDADSIGEKVMEYSCAEYTRYLYDINYGITLPANKTYLTSNMVKAAPDTKVPMSVQVVTRHGGNTGIPGVTYWSTEGEAIENSVTLTHDWQTRQATFSATSDLSYYTTMYITYDAMDPIRLDEHYVGELLISSVAVKDTSGQPTATIGIPAETKTINLNASVLNQMGTKAGFVLSGDNANVNMNWRVLGNPAGVSVSNGVVTVTPDAEPGTVIVEAVAQPTYPGAAQTEVSGRYKLIINDMQYKANGQVIQTIGNYTGDVVCALHYTNGDATACDIRFFTAVYKKVGNKLTLEDVVSEGYTVQPSKSVTDELTVTIPNDGNVYVIKSFVWNENLRPKMFNGLLE